ncbi:MAG: carotenoid 1,2-hydratase [Sedimenticola sp.]|nr:carotenoid 1,2-hydratase [Sedimenticola sp.]
MRRPWLLLLLPLLLVACREPAPAQEPFSASGLLSSLSPEGFARARTVREFRFPEDHGGHPDYRNEWWYFTGNLESGEGRRFGYQVTFFRFSLQPPTDDSPPSAWAGNPVWMAHVALTDAEGGGHLAQERLIRSGPGLAGVEVEPLRVWLQDWQLRAGDTGFPWQLDIDAAGFSLKLELQPGVGVVLQGDQGLSQKSAQPGNASYYYSLPRMQSTGSISVAGKTHRVSGLSWFDREWGTSALAPDQAGWDWFSLQFNNGESLMFYHLRQQNGESDPHSAGSLVGANGVTQPLGLDDVELTPLDWWDGPNGNRYPVAWSLRLKRQQRALIVRAILPDQEMDLSVRYWEGAVDVVENGLPVGRGYMELTGY